MPTLPAHDPIDYRRTFASVHHDLFGSEEPVIRLGRFEVTGSAGAGRMGRVYVAHDPELKRKVAIKVIAADEDDDRSQEREARLVREARAIARLSHPNVIAVHEVGHHGDELFVVMEYIEGETLRRWIRQPRPWRDVVRVMIGAGRGLAAAHRAGLVHRDFKPDNVMIRDDGRVVVLDFGLARAADLAGITSPRQAAIDAASSGEVGPILGTPAYMAPELLGGATADAQSDQFAYCVALFEALHGARPFSGANMVQLAARLEAGPGTGGRTIPDWLDQLVRRGLRLRPEDRHHSMDTLLAELGKRRTSPRTVALVGLGIIAVAGIGAAGARALDSDVRCDVGSERAAERWDDERRAALDETIRAGLTYGDELAPRTLARLDAYASTWAAAYQQACEQTHVLGEQSAQMLDLRMRCLADRLAAFDSVVTVLLDGEHLDRSLEAADGLPSTEACGDPNQLRATIPEPTRPRVREAVSAARADLSKARALRSAGRYDEALALAREVEGRKIEHAPLRAEALFAIGMALHLNHADTAEATLREAANVAEAARHDRAAADAWLKIVPATADDERAALYLERAEAAVARLSEPPRLVEALWVARGQRAVAAGEYDAAIEAASRARELAAARPDGATASAHYGLELTRAASLKGDYRSAAQYATQTYEELTRVYGAAHPTLRRALNNRGATLMLGGQPAQAVAVFEEAVAMARRLNGPNHPEVVSPLHNLGAAYQHLGRFEQAIARYEEAEAIQEAAWGPDDHRLAQGRANIARCLGELGRHEEAIASARAAVEMFTRGKGADHPEIAGMHSILGSIYVGAGAPRAGRAVAADGPRARASSPRRRQCGGGEVEGPLGGRAAAGRADRRGAQAGRVRPRRSAPPPRGAACRGRGRPGDRRRDRAGRRCWAGGLHRVRAGPRAVRALGRTAGDAGGGAARLGASAAFHRRRSGARTDAGAAGG